MPSYFRKNKALRKGDLGCLIKVMGTVQMERSVGWEEAIRVIFCGLRDEVKEGRGELQETFLLPRGKVCSL